MHKIFFVIILFLPVGCALQQRDNNKLANQLQQQSPEQVLALLQQTKPDETDLAQYDLNTGYLQLVSGDFESAITSFSNAKQEMRSLSAISVTENLAAGTVNETFRRYSGYPTDLVMVHNMLALSYLFNQDIYGARVEMLQANVAMKKLVTGKSLSGQLASTHIVSGIVYELLDERSNAFISYKFAEGILSERKFQIPTALKLGLLRMSDKMGNEKQFKAYSKKYPGFIDRSKTEKQVFTVYFDGVVANKIEKTVLVPSHDQEQLIRISMPAYPKMTNRIARVKLSDGKRQVVSELIENVDLLVREDLDKEYPSILLLTTTRAVAKYNLVQNAHEQNSFAGVLLNIATVLSEVADVRSWNMLPATIQFGYIETNSDNLVVSTINSIDADIDISTSKQHVILATGLSDKTFHYQQ